MKNEAADSDPASTKGFLGVTRFKNARLSSTEEQDLLLCPEAAAAVTRDRKQNPFSQCTAFYSEGASFLQKLRKMLRDASEKHPLTFKKFVLTGIRQTKNFFLPVKKYSSTKSLFLSDLADK